MNTKVKNQRDESDELHLSKHIHFDQIDSTNTWPKIHSDEWAVDGITLITAAEQTAGRGRFKRRWESPPHVNIYATFCFWLNAQHATIGHIPQLLALAAAHILEKRGFKLAIKWPNDLLLAGKKVGGILCETIRERQQCGVICGIGLNVNMPQEALNRIDRPATSLLVERGHPFDLMLILEDLKDCFRIYLNRFIRKGFHLFFPLFQARSALKQGQMIRFHDNQTLLDAQFERLHPDGSVQLRLLNGTSKIFHAGEFVDQS